MAVLWLLKSLHSGFEHAFLVHTHTESKQITLFIIVIEKSRDDLGFSPERFLKPHSRRH